MKIKRSSRILAIMVCFTLAIGLVPVQALAEAAGGPTSGPSQAANAADESTATGGESLAPGSTQKPGSSAATSDNSGNGGTENTSSGNGKADADTGGNSGSQSGENDAQGETAGGPAGQAAPQGASTDTANDAIPEATGETAPAGEAGSDSASEQPKTVGDVMAAADSEPTVVMTVEELQAAIANASTDEENPTRIKLGNAISTSNMIECPSGYVELDLAGCELSSNSGAPMIFIAGAHLTVKGDGSIANTGESGTAVVIATGGSLVLETGSISADNDGVAIATGGSFTMNGGTVSGAKLCGVVNSGTFIMNGGTVSGNAEDTQQGTGVWNLDIFKLAGDPSIAGGVAGVYLEPGKVITIDDALTHGTPIGVATKTEPTSGNPVVITSGFKDNNPDKNPADCFTSANPDYAVVWNADKTEAALAVTHKVNIDSQISNGAVSADKQTAGEGDTVTLTVKPAAGYQLKSLTVNQEHTKVETTKTDEGNYTFTMPTGDVTVTAEFEKLYTVTFASEDGKTVLQSSQLALGETPKYTGKAPTKAADQGYTYAWSGWTDGSKSYSKKDALPAVSGDITYKATFKATAKPGVYQVVSGANGTWTKGLSTPYNFTIKRTVNDEKTFGHFTGVKIDGKTVPKKNSAGQFNYTAKSGSVIVGLQPSYLSTLSTGEHTFAASFDDGSDATASFTVKAKDTTPNNNTSPNTGDESGGMAVLTLAIAAAAAALFVFARKRASSRR